MLWRSAHCMLSHRQLRHYPPHRKFNTMSSVSFFPFNLIGFFRAFWRHNVCVCTKVSAKEKFLHACKATRLLFEHFYCTSITLVNVMVKVMAKDERGHGRACSTTCIKEILFSDGMTSSFTSSVFIKTHV